MHFQLETNLCKGPTSQAHALCVNEATLLWHVPKEIWYCSAEITKNIQEKNVASIYASALMVPLHMQITHVMGTDATVWMAFLLFGIEPGIIFLKASWDVNLSDRKASAILMH